MEVSANNRWIGAGIELTWQPERNLALMRFVEPLAKGTAEHAQSFVDQLNRWTAGTTRRYGVLVDCAGIEDTDPGWRTVLHDYYRHSDVHVFVAWYNLNPVTRLMAEMFVVGSKTIDGKLFADEPEARRWLKTHGIG